MKKYLIFLLTLSTLYLTTGCSGEISNGAVGKTYQFNSKGFNFSCGECNSEWFIKVESETSARIYSAPSSTSMLKSCATDIQYVWDSTTGSIIIEEVINSNVNSNCRSNFIGTFTFNGDGDNGRGFYKKNGFAFTRK